MQGNKKISFTAEAAALIRTEEKVDNYSKIFVTPRARRIYDSLKLFMPSTLKKIFQKRAALSRSIIKILGKHKFEQIVEIGAGYSATGIQLTKENKKLIYIETDFPEVIRTKKSSLKHISPANLLFIPIDITKDNLQAKLLKLLNRKKKTAIFSEGVSSYLNSEQHNVMIKHIKGLLDHLPKAVYISHERFGKGSMTSGFFGRTLRTALSLGIGNKSYQHFKNPEEAKVYYKERGLDNFKILERNKDFFVYSVP